MPAESLERTVNKSTKPKLQKVQSPSRGPKPTLTAASKTKRSTASSHTAKTPSMPHVRDGSKLAEMIALLRRREGATIDQMAKATGWQTHSVRGAMSGALKKKLGLIVTSSKADGVRTYRITTSSAV
jgi:hypothetical protein